MVKRGLLVVLIALLALPLATLQAQGPGEVLYEDDFSNVKTGWEVDQFDGGEIGYGDGFYVVTSTGSGNMMWGVAGQEFTDAVITVDATQVLAPNNDNNGYGVMCRVQPDGGGYLLYISGDGYAAIVLAEEEYSVLTDWTPVDAVVQGNNTNHLEATCNGTNLSLVVNGVPVATAEDDTYASGDIALSATSFEDTPTEIHFDDIVVTAPSGAPVEPVEVTPMEAEPTVEAEVLPSASFSDDFSDETSGWEIADYDNGSTGYGDGFYFVTAQAAGILEYGAAQRNFSDITIDVDTTQVLAPANDNNGYGVMCRVQPNGDGYLLRISGDGFASIVIGADDDFTALADWVTTDAVVQGNAVNHIQALCDGSHLALYVNGELVVETDDDTFSSGDIAMTASTYEDEPTEIHFDNVEVSILNGDSGTSGSSKNAEVPAN